MPVLCTERDSHDIKDGTLCRAESPKPGLLGWLWSRAESAVEAEYSSITSAVSSAVTSSLHAVNAAYHLVEHDLICAGCLAEAYVQSQILAPRAILEETGHELGEILKGLLPSIGLMLLVLGTTTALGATIGGVISGIFSAGALAVPGAIAGGEVGFDIGMAALTWLGVAFLIVSMAEGLKEAFALLKQGILDGWAAGSLTGAEQKREVERSARGLARTQGVFFRVLLQGIIAYLLKEAGIKSTKSAAQTAAVIRSAGVGAAAEGTVLRANAAAARMAAAVDTLVKRLRANRWLGGTFADWVARDWGKMMENPKLEMKTSTAATEEAAGQSHVGHSSNGTGGQLSRRYGDFSKKQWKLPKGTQANHLNQDAAFRDVIPSNEGAAVGMRGNAFTEPGTSHYEFHKSLESFWDQFRDEGERFGERPTNREYADALDKALRDSGLPDQEVSALKAEAQTNREAYGLSDSDLVPRIPGKIWQKLP